MRIFAYFLLKIYIDIAVEFQHKKIFKMVSRLAENSQIKGPVRFWLRRSILQAGLKWRFKSWCFSYFISRYKCCGPNETNFMDFGQKLVIFSCFTKYKRISYFHMGYTLAHKWIKVRNPLFISRYKYCRPNGTNFMDFGQKLFIFLLFYDK